MIAVGASCLLAYPVYEWKFAKYPSMPKRIVFNRSFNNAVLINVVCSYYFLFSNEVSKTISHSSFCSDMIAAYLQLLYLSSYVYIVTDISDRNWNCKFNHSSLSRRFRTNLSSID